MAQWFEFTSDYDHRWPSGAVTAFKDGMKVHVKEEVAKAAKEAGAGHKTEKPREGSPEHYTTPTREEGGRRRRGEVRHVKMGGAVKTGNPLVLQRAELPDPSSPDAVRSEPLIERGRAETRGRTLTGEPLEQPEESAGQIEATDKPVEPVE